MDEHNYLTNIPDIAKDHGFCKTLVVRREVIHVKHIMTEIFVRKTIDVRSYFDRINYDLFRYIEYITNRLRKVHHFSRQYNNDCDSIVKDDRDKFFPTLELYNGLNNCIVLDFDGVVTSNNFQALYLLCHQRSTVIICSANPTITEDWFIKRNLPIPYKIYSMKGKEQKIKQLIEIQKKYDYVFYIDDEVNYLEFAWLFGIQTYHWTNNKIKYFTLKTK